VKIALMLHVLAVVIWVGGMFFAYVALRPAAAAFLEPPQRLTLWRGTFARFFPWVWVCVAAILGSGLYLVMAIGGFGAVPLYIDAMFGVGLVMMMIFAHVFFAPYGRLKRFVTQQEWKPAGGALSQIRVLIGINLGLGLLNIVIAMLGDML
jgi:uncharacterized membrane protein